MDYFYSTSLFNGAVDAAGYRAPNIKTKNDEL